MKSFLLIIAGSLLTLYLSAQEGSGCLYGNCVNGYGYFRWDDGEKYIGNWKDGKRSGIGINFWADESTYAGEWQGNLRNGHGLQVDADGSERVGIWDAGEFAKTFILLDSTGCIYGNCTSSYGVYLWDSGETYMGYWANDKRNGTGINFFTNGNFYVGEWNEDYRKGFGINIADEVTCGYWEDNVCINPYEEVNE
jgi:hypothetical protein